MEKEKKTRMFENITRVAQILPTQRNQVLEFKVYRDNENDPFKPNSESAVKILASHPTRRTLQPEDEQLLQGVAADMDRALSVEEIITSPYLLPKMDFDCYLQIERLPTWLKSMIRARFDIIQSHFKNNTTKFIKSLATKIEQRNVTKDELYGGFEFGGESPSKAKFNIEEEDLEDKEPTAFEKSGGKVAVRVAEAVQKFKRKRDSETSWDKQHIAYAAEKLRNSLSLRANIHDLLLVEEDANFQRETREEEESSDSDEEDIFINEKVNWDNMFQPGELEHYSQNYVNKTLLLKPSGGGGGDDADDKSESEESETDEELKAKEKKNKSKKRISLPKMKWLEKKRKKEKELVKRGHFRKYSKLFYTGCGDQARQPQRLEHHHRLDESFHSFCATLVSWGWFQAFIMFIIFLNAIVLAAETFQGFEEVFMIFEFFDELFLAIYLTEAIVKIYAHPFRYWTSGFNVFDFFILCVSIVKSVIDWLNIADLAFLRVFLIVRALRVLRSISLSVQLQVLVTALIKTVRKHVASVVILLFLLIYIAAIVAFYLFGDKLQETWGFVPQGMLRMIAYVTLDGWTDLQQDFEEAGLELEGRFFNLICIVLGNFMFSNIFIAIIIFNISEATDLFRERLRAERENIVKRKKESVFRRQKLDMRQLLARQKKSFSADFFYMATQFQKLLRHDDLVATKETCTSPLWIDAVFQTLLRTTHTSNILLNLHREMADNILHLHRHHGQDKMQEKEISRGRYNRYMKIKAKLALIKKEILRYRHPPDHNLRIRFEKKKEK